MAITAIPRLHDRVVLVREVDGVPAGATGGVVQVFDNGYFGIDLDDPDLIDRLDGIVDVPVDAVALETPAASTSA